MRAQAGQGRLRVIAGRWRGRLLQAPPGWELRPTQGTVREAIFSRLQEHLPGSKVVDLFAGSGALGLEALSRGAEQVLFVEENRAALEVLETNIGALAAADRCAILSGDVFAFLAGKLRSPVEVDLLFADPPYGESPRRTALALGEASGLRWRRSAIRVIEMGRDDPSWEPEAGWSRWPERVYGKTRIVIEQRESDNECER